LSIAESPPPALDLGKVALFLDLDGTLAEIALQPGDVAPTDRRTRLLRRLSEAAGCGVAVLTGRDLAEADRILDGSVAAMAAVHGLVRRSPDGAVRQVTPSPGLQVARLALASLANEVPGLLVEDKGSSVALHYRQAPGSEALVEEVAAGLVEVTDLVLQEGAMVFELRTPGPDKGDSLRAFMAEPPFAGCLPVMVGDDLTDEYAFAAAEALGGYGVLVGPARPTSARYRLPTVADVLDWLEQAAWR
jgi:trehalose 6-phosphate phosphatase